MQTCNVHMKVCRDIQRYEITVEQGRGNIIACRPWWGNQKPPPRTPHDHGGERGNVVLDKFFRYEEKWTREKIPKTRIRLVFYADFVFTRNLK